VRLSNAAHFIRQQIPEEVADLEKRYGHKKLKGIILATEYFDISEELSDKGGVRILYRIKPELNLIDWCLTLRSTEVWRIRCFRMKAHCVTLC